MERMRRMEELKLRRRKSKEIGMVRQSLQGGIAWRYPGFLHSEASSDHWHTYPVQSDWRSR